MDSEANNIESTKEIDDEIIELHNSISKETQEQVFERDNHRCQTKGCVGIQRGGTAQLLVQPLADETVEGDIDPDNCTTICQRCARWMAQMPTTADLRPQLKQRLNGANIPPNWSEVLDYLDNHGPASVSEILENVTLDSKPGVRFALYSLMSIDIRKDEINEQIIVKDRINRTYGLPRQVPEQHDARGVIPIQPSERHTRILDEIARRLDDEISEEVDDSSEIIARIVDRKPKHIRKLKRRAEAFDYPFEAWAANKYPKQVPATVIDAVSTLANCTDNVSRQLLSSAIIDVFEANDEGELAELLNNWAQSNEEYKKQSSSPGRSIESDQSALADHESSSKQNQQTLDDKISPDNRTAQDNSKNGDSAGRSLSSLSLAESETTADTSEEESNDGLN